MSRIRAFWVISALRLCCIYALLSRIRFCRQYALILVCFVQTFTQTLRILLRFCADICPKNWSLRPLLLILIGRAPSDTEVTSYRNWEIIFHQSSAKSFWVILKMVRVRRLSMGEEMTMKTCPSMTPMLGNEKFKAMKSPPFPVFLCILFILLVLLMTLVNWKKSENT